jgi:hypothetical protein
MQIDKELIREGVYNAFSFWLIEHEVTKQKCRGLKSSALLQMNTIHTIDSKRGQPLRAFNTRTSQINRQSLPVKRPIALRDDYSACVPIGQTISARPCKISISKCDVAAFSDRTFDLAS